MRGPDFFIVGAPKCGTTAMANYLTQHPEIGMCARKETHYLSPDLRPRLATRRRRRGRTLDWYLELFSEVQDKARLGEASVWYLYSASAAVEIQRFAPDAQVILMLRSPAEMLPALHSEFVHQEIEPVEDFEAALALDAERERSGTPAGFPPTSYRAAVRYADQIRRYLDVLGRARLHVILFEDFAADTLGAFRGTCEFLGVDDAFEPQIEVINANRKSRSRTMQRLVRRPPEPLRVALHAVSSEGGRRRVAHTLTRWNRTFDPREPLSADAMEALRPEVEREIEALRSLLGLDLDRWLAPLPTSNARRA